jgi:hypothetical protein
MRFHMKRTTLVLDEQNFRAAGRYRFPPASWAARR